MGAVPVGHNSIIDLKDVPCEEVDMGETNAYHFSLEGEFFMHKEQAYVELLQEILYNLNMRKACKSSNGETLQI